MQTDDAEPNHSKRRHLLVLPAALAAAGMFAAACSSSSPTSKPAAAAAHSTGSPASSTSGSTLVHSGTVASVGLVLTNPQGLTLYRLTTDHGSSTCNASCAATWPPLTVSSGTKPSAVSSLHGKFGTITRSDGTTQVTYNGWPLYTFAGDTKAGQANGQGISGVWYAVTPTVVAATSSASPATTTQSTTTTTASSGGGGYGGY